MTEGGTFLGALCAALDRAAAHSPGQEVAPVALLWPDGVGEWAPLLPALRGRRRLLALGPQDPAGAAGGAAWIRWQLAQPVVESVGTGPVPAVYLPGISAAAMRAGAGRSAGPLDDLAVLADLRHRGAVWARPNGQDWTVRAFLSDPDEGLGVEVRRDPEVDRALQRVLPILAGVSVARLQEEAPWRVADIDSLAGFGPRSVEPSVRDLIAGHEGVEVELKSSIRWDVKRACENKDLEINVVKSVAAFLNADGGHLVVGVDDNGAMLGLERDQTLICKKTRDWDALERHLMQLFRTQFGVALMPYVRVRFHDVEGKDVAVVAVRPAPEPAVVTEKGQEVLYVRAGNATLGLKLREAIPYLRQRWPPGG